jgi:hypothetical protein
MRFIALTVRFSLSVVFAVSLSTLSFAQSAKVSDDLSHSFRKYSVARLATSSPENINSSARRLSVSVNGEQMELDVVPNDLRAPNYRAEDTGPVGTHAMESPEVTTYKGTVVGRAGTEVRLTIDGTRVEGFFNVGADRFFIEPATKYSKSASAYESVIYKAEDSLVDNSFACEADIPTRIKAGDQMAGLESVGSLEAQKRLDVATEADLEFVNTIGSASAANSEILSILNMVEGTYSAELNLKIRVTYQHTWTTADPYAGSSTSAILSNFQNYWNANLSGAPYPRNTAHLFTAKSNALSQGIAYLGVICLSSGASYGLSGYISWVPGKYLVPAHEIGHNLGAQHVDATQSCANTLMNAQLTGSTPMTFCSYSQNQINSFIATNGACMVTILQQPAAPVGKRFDFDGDKKADIAVFRPSNGNWYVTKSSGGYSQFQFGIPGDKPVSADYDGDGKTDAAIYRNGTWWRLLSVNNTVDSVNFGVAGDIPVPANFDTDARADVAVYRPSNGTWYWIKSSNGVFHMQSFGVNGDTPLPADFDGDGIAELNVFRPANGTWYRIDSSTGIFRVTQYGLNGDEPLIADFDGDSKSDIAVYRPATSEWFIIRSSDSGYRYYVFGIRGDIPATGDFDGDGISDIAVFRPADGTWHRINSSNAVYEFMQYGLSGDTPVPSYYIQ